MFFLLQASFKEVVALSRKQVNLVVDFNLRKNLPNAILPWSIRDQIFRCLLLHEPSNKNFLINKKGRKEQNGFLELIKKSYVLSKKEKWLREENYKFIEAQIGFVKPSVLESCLYCRNLTPKTHSHCFYCTFQVKARHSYLPRQLLVGLNRWTSYLERLTSSQSLEKVIETLAPAVECHTTLLRSMIKKPNLSTLFFKRLVSQYQHRTQAPPLFFCLIKLDLLLKKRSRLPIKEKEVLFVLKNLFLDLGDALLALLFLFLESYLWQRCWQAIQMELKVFSLSSSYHESKFVFLPKSYREGVLSFPETEKIFLGLKKDLRIIKNKYLLSEARKKVVLRLECG